MATERYEEAKCRVLAVGEARLLHGSFSEKAVLVYSAHNTKTRGLQRQTLAFRSPLSSETGKYRAILSSFRTEVVIGAIERY